ncbi:immediate early response gene 2 protein [Sardina pilchardus]|uniref:immediate early response gene 2 protein n=1 Tax=Sardina pilchardus TaxID=27697 RepID=UPI002E1388B3
MSQPQSETMDVTTEAKRIMVQALGKMYTLRTQRGGLRLHRSLLITLVMKSARDIYHSYRIACEQQEQQANFTGVTAESCQTAGTGTACVLEDGNSSLASNTQETQNSKTNVQSDPHNHDSAESEDKENLSSTRPERHSRKRRGKAAVEPDFLPCKKAKMEAEEIRRNSHSAPLRTCCGVKDSLTHIPMQRSIVSF